MNPRTKKSSEPPFAVRVIYMIIGVFLMVGVPIKGVAVIADGKFEQGPSNNVRTGQTYEGFELRGAAARAIGAGFIGLGLSAGYFTTFWIARKPDTNRKASRLDKAMGVLLAIGIILLVVCRALPGS